MCIVKTCVFVKKVVLLYLEIVWTFIYNETTTIYPPSIIGVDDDCNARASANQGSRK